MVILPLIQQYLAQLRSPPVLLAILVVVGPVVLEIFKNKVLPQGISKIEGCFKLGVSKRGDMNKHDKTTKKPRIKALLTYPIKSCRGIELAASEVGPTGLKYDRLFTFAQLVSKPGDGSNLAKNTATEVSSKWKHEWRFITQREFPRLALLETELWVPEPKTRKKASSNDEISNIVAEKSNDLQKLQQSESETQAPPSQVEVIPSDSKAEEGWSENGGCLIVRFPYEPDFNPLGIRTENITIRLPVKATAQRAKAKQYTHETLNIWKDYPTAINISNEIFPDHLTKLKYFLGVSNPLALFRVDDGNHRAVTRSLPKSKQADEKYSVGFADAFPLHMLSLASVHALDQHLPETARPMKGKLDPRRFRANIYITGSAAYDEDTWKRATAGRSIKGRSNSGKILETDGEYHVACRTARCKLPNVHQETGVKDVNEPYNTLARTRKVDEGAYPHPCLGMQMIPLFQQGLLKVGDEIKVLERGEHYYEKMFS